MLYDYKTWHITLVSRNNATHDYFKDKILYIIYYIYYILYIYIINYIIYNILYNITGSCFNYLVIFSVTFQFHAETAKAVMKYSFLYIYIFK